MQNPTHICTLVAELTKYLSMIIHVCMSVFWPEFHYSRGV